MSSIRRLQATFDSALPAREIESVGVSLGFRPDRSRADIDRIDDFANLGPELTVPAVAGLGKVLRILRAARIALPGEPASLIGRSAVACSLLDRALGTRLCLEVRPRSRLCFIAWTEDGVETIDDVSDVLETDDAYCVLRRRGRAPVRMSRDLVVRWRTHADRWFEVVGIERA